MSDVKATIEQQIKDHSVLLYMKGSKEFPMCGFSGQVVHMLKQCGAEFTTVNVLEDADIRQGIKDFSHWPTIPQLYINGEFVGGCDIITELFQSGELQKKLSSQA